MIPANRPDVGRPVLVTAGWQTMVRWLWEIPEVNFDVALKLFAAYGNFLQKTKSAVKVPSPDWENLNRLYSGAVRGNLRIGLKPDGFLQAIRRVFEVLPRMRKCGRPDCHHPFFLARRSSDVYCCKDCALWGKRKSNLKSWQKNWKRWPSCRWRAKGGRKKYGRGKRE
jgi:hypothetical protein